MTTQTEPSVNKAALRAEALSRRAALDPTERIEASLAIAEYADDLPFPPGAVVSAFLPIRDEIDPRPLMDRLRQAGHPLCLPAIVEGRLVFRAFSRETALVRAGFGTVEPGPEAPVIAPEAMLVPLAAFDRTGHRIGYGKGYYDCAIQALRQSGAPVCVGVAFSVQEVDGIPAEDHDQPLAFVLTEKGLFPCGAER